MSTSKRIDVHTHLVPPFWAAELGDHGGDPSGWTVPEWSVDVHLDFMDANGIATSVLSLTAPSVVGWEGQDRRALARRINEFTADIVRERPTRFGNFATLPLPDVDGAVAEAEYALSELGADGVVLLTNYDGVYLGDERYTPLWETLQAHGAVLFIHPGKPGIATVPEVPGPVVDYPFDSTRNAVHMVTHAIPERYPDVRIVLSHAGGFLPFAALRFAELQSGLDPDGPPASDRLDSFRTFYFDTALSSGPYAFPSLTAFAAPGHILYGSDFPYAPASVAGRFTRLLETESGLDAAQRSAIDRDNARAIFPRLA